MDDVFKEIISYAKIELIGLKTELTLSQNLNFEIISKHWKIFNSALHQIKDRSSFNENWVKYGVTYKENDIYYYLASIPHDLQYSYPSKMIRKKIPAGFYALFYHKGKMINIKNTVSCIFKKSIPLNNFTIINSEIIYFEKYDAKFHWNNPNSIIELFVPINNKTCQIFKT